MLGRHSTGLTLGEEVSGKKRLKVPTCCSLARKRSDQKQNLSSWKSERHTFNAILNIPLMKGRTFSGAELEATGSGQYNNICEQIWKRVISG
jgi:hypothetical protein